MTPIKKLFYKTPNAGAQTQIMLAVEPDLALVTGKFFVSCNPKEPSSNAHDDETAEWLWIKSSDMTSYSNKKTNK